MKVFPEGPGRLRLRLSESLVLRGDDAPATDISTTMRYYVGQNAQAPADELWRAKSSNLGIRGEKEEFAEREQPM